MRGAGGGVARYTRMRQTPRGLRSLDVSSIAYVDVFFLVFVFLGVSLAC